MLKEGDTSENPIDRHYHAMKCDMTPIDHTSEEFKVHIYINNFIIGKQ